ncbi:MAG TPA: hypothetical protein VGH38_16285 [Bryobacteraceae bacterium]
MVASDRIYDLREEADGSFGIRCFRRAKARLEDRPDPQSLFRGMSLSPAGKYLLQSETRVESNLILVEDLR